MIDIAKGGSVDGVISGLNKILDLSFAETGRRAARGSFPATDGYPIPPMWPLTGIWSMIRDRVQDLIDKGMTLAQVKAARPSIDFDGRYGSTTGPWTTDMFIEACVSKPQEKK